jgi:hypothetical protein
VGYKKQAGRQKKTNLKNWAKEESNLEEMKTKKGNKRDKVVKKGNIVYLQSYKERQHS